MLLIKSNKQIGLNNNVVFKNILYTGVANLLAAYFYRSMAAQVRFANHKEKKQNATRIHIDNDNKQIEIKIR